MNPHNGILRDNVSNDWSIKLVVLLICRLMNICLNSLCAKLQVLYERRCWLQSLHRSASDINTYTEDVPNMNNSYKWLTQGLDMKCRLTDEKLWNKWWSNVVTHNYVTYKHNLASEKLKHGATESHVTLNVYMKQTDMFVSAAKKMRCDNIRLQRNSLCVLSNCFPSK